MEGAILRLEGLEGLGLELGVRRCVSLRSIALHCIALHNKACVVEVFALHLLGGSLS